MNSLGYTSVYMYLSTTVGSFEIGLATMHSKEGDGLGYKAEDHR